MRFWKERVAVVLVLRVIVIVSLLLSLLLPSALAGSALDLSSRAVQQTSEIPKGRIVEKLECLADSSQSYAVYLPSNYTVNRKWPILYAFDPGARGKVPVERFKDAAEKYGWIVVGSNNSRNGPWDLAVNAWNAMQKDTHQRFSIDDDRMYATGFSGGARVAVRIAAACNCLAGVIASGAGFPIGLAPAPSMHFAFFGAAGVDDFNFAELRSLDEPLTKAGITHRIQTFDGGHQWPPAPEATAAIEWMELQAMSAGKRQRDPAFIDAIWQQQTNQAKALEGSKKYVEAYQLYLDLAQSFKGLREVSEIENKVAQLRDSRELKSAMREEQDQITKQRDLERQLRTLIARRERVALQDSRIEETTERPATESNPISRSQGTEEGFDPGNRLEGLLSELQKRSKTAEDSGSRRVARRVLESLFIGFFEQGLASLQETRHAQAVAYFKLATEINPDRPGAHFYLASAYAAKGDKKKALQALNNAVEKGFSDLAAISANRMFDSIRSDPGFQKILQRLKG